MIWVLRIVRDRKRLECSAALLALTTWRVGQEDDLNRVCFPCPKWHTLCRRGIVSIQEMTMNEPKKQPVQDASTPAADREIPHGTDEHSGDEAKHGEDRSTTSQPSKRDNGNASDER